ncbi:hypothetical protein ACFYTQ_26265 [Nocardia sp. NPDC004068]|uniref:WXG100-like domain-containing protein n=1 Tax=Nocardia sp. NPDC004068 TaxID=3364303 RepID=UPI00367F374E
MALYLPPELRWVSYIAGAEWPDGDEDKMFAMGDEWKNAAKQLEALLDEIKTVQNELRSAYASGTGGEQAVAEVGKLLSGKGSVDELAKYMTQIGQSTRNAGTTMEQTKLMVIVSLSLLAAEIALAWLFPPTAPGVEAAAVGATRAFLYRLGRQVMAFLESIPGVGKLIGQFVKFVKIVPDLPSKAGDLLANPIGLGVKRITPARTLLDMMPEAMARNPFVRDVFDVMPDEFAKWLVKSGVNVGLWSGGQDLLVQTIQIAKGHRDELNGQELGLSMGASMVGKWASHLPAVYVEKWGGDLFKSFGIDSTRGLAGMVNGAATGMTTNVVSGLAGAGLYSLVTGTSYYDNIKTAQIGAAVTGAMVGGQRGFIGQLGARPGTGADFTATHPELNVGTGGGNRLGLGGTDGGGNGGRGGGPNPSDGSGSHGGGQNSLGGNGSRSGEQNSLGGNGSRSGGQNALGSNGSRGGADDITPVAHGGDNTGGNRPANPAPPARGFAEQQQALRDQHEQNYSTARDLDRANQNFIGRQARNLNPFSDRPARYSINRDAEIARHGAEMDALNSREKVRIATEHAQDAAQRATDARNAARDADRTARAAEAAHDPNATTLRAQADRARVQAMNAARAATETNSAVHAATADATGAQDRLAGLRNDPAMRNSWDSVAAARQPTATGGDRQGHELQGHGGDDGNHQAPQHVRSQEQGDGDGGPLPKPQRDAADALVERRRAELAAAIDKHEAANNAVRQRLDTMQQRLDTLQQNRGPLQDRVDTARAARDDAEQHVADIRHRLRDTDDPMQRANLKADLRQAQHDAVRAQRDLDAAEGNLRHIDRDIGKQHDRLNSVASRILSGAPKEVLNVLPHAVKDGPLDTQKNAQAAVATAKADLDAAIADQQRAHGIPVTPAPTLTESHATVNQHGANVQTARDTLAAPEPAAVTNARANVTAYDNAHTVLNTPEPPAVTNARANVTAYDNAQHLLNTPEPPAVTNARANITAYDNAHTILNTPEPPAVTNARANVTAYDNAQHLLNSPEPADVAAARARLTIDEHDRAQHLLNSPEPSAITNARNRIADFDQAHTTLTAPEPAAVTNARAALASNPGDTGARNIVEQYTNDRAAARNTHDSLAPGVAGDRAAVTAYDNNRAAAQATVNRLAPGIADDRATAAADARNRPAPGLDADRATVNRHDTNRAAAQTTVDNHRPTIANDRATVTHHDNTRAAAQSTIDHHQPTITGDRATVTHHDNTRAAAQTTVDNHRPTIANDRATVTHHDNTRAAAQTTVDNHRPTIANDRATVTNHDNTRAAAQSTIDRHGAAVDRAGLTIREHDQRAAMTAMLGRAGITAAAARAELAAFDKAARRERQLEDGTFYSGRVRARKIKLSELMPDPFTAVTAPGADFWADPVNVKPPALALADSNGKRDPALVGTGGNSW